MVYVEAAEQAVLTDLVLREPLKIVPHLWYLGGVAVVLCVIAAVVVRRIRRRAAARTAEKN